MVPSLSLTRETQHEDVSELRVVDASLTLNENVAPSTFRSRRALLIHAHSQLSALSQRQQARDMEPYRIVLRLLGTLVTDGSPTPQIGDNGDGGVAVEWLVDGNSLRLDYEDETEILLTAKGSDGERVLCETVNVWWLASDLAVMQARDFLRNLAQQVSRPLPIS